MADASIELASICRKHGLIVDEGQISLLSRYVKLLLEWNGKINLVSRRDEENVWQSHILHSIAPLFVVHVEQGSKVLDLGSGGGLPGIPLAVMRADVRVTLLDSIQKKVKAVRAIVDELGVSNVEVVLGRAEDQRDQLAERFDVVVARAVAPLVDLIQWSKPLVRPRAPGALAVGAGLRVFRVPYLLAFKGGDLEREIEVAERRTGVAGIATVDLLMGDEAGGKKLVVVEL